MRKPTLRQLEAFKAFVETGSVSKAAEAIHISQPAASKLLHHLEDDTEMRLIDRTKGRMTPTDKGMRVYEEIDRIMSGIDQISQAISLIRHEEQSLITIGVTPGFPLDNMVNATQEVLNRHPNVNLSYVVRSSEYLLHGLLSKKIDVAFVAQRNDHPLLSTQVFYEDPICVAMRKDHPLIDHEILSVEDLAEHELVSFGIGSATRKLSDQLFSDANLVPKIRITATTAPQICALTAAGFGASIISPLFASDYKNDLVMKPLANAKSVSIYESRSIVPRDSDPIDTLVEYLKKQLLHL